MGSLTNLRQHLDQLDDQIVLLLRKRLEITEQIAEYKNAEGFPLTDVKREEEIINRIEKKIQNPVYKEILIRLYQRIMEEAKNLRGQSYQ